MKISNITSNNPRFGTKKINNESNSKEKQSLSPKAKVAISAAIGVGALGFAYYAGKHHLLGDGIYNFLNKTPARTEAFVSDKLSYEIQPPVYDKSIKPVPGEGNYLIYEDILKNMRADEGTNKRLDEVLRSMSEDLNAINNKIAAATNGEVRTLEPGQTIISPVDVAKKRFYSLPENAQPGYGCVDPLLYQKSREEIVDLYTGYGLLEELNFGTESKLLTDLTHAYEGKIKPDDSAFIQECVDKLMPENAKCHGQDSVLHCYDMFRIGKIFREAMGLKVR